MRTLLLAAVAVAALGGCSGAPTDTAGLAPHTDSSPSPSPSPSQPSEQDRAWMRGIHEGNLAEMQLGQLGAGKGGTKQIRAIGKLIVKDHTEFDTKVTKAATQLGIKLPESPTADQRADVVRLREATRKGFDQEFLAIMTNAHTQAIAATQTEIARGSSPAVVALARTALPTLEKHLAVLRQAEGGGASPSPSLSPSPGTETPVSPMTPTGHE
ncbi:DUF4142 domain-containing protein [Nonomuraea sp. NPDC050786]|uniref:DUF4142 domain-containing protein n=1 Tax=Nonomuraea sp. NPDC050786 TaxID=3154840 RepID=UPI0033DA987B